MDEKSNKQLENERNIQNNANNIRNAADVAIATKNPYGVAIGGAIKAGDNLTGGKVSEAAGRSLNNYYKHKIGGKKMQNYSNKLNESGASDKIGAAARMKNGMSKDGNAASSSSAASEKLKQNKANRNSNKTNNGKKKSGLSNLFSSNNDSSNSNKSLSSTSGEEEEGLIAKIQKIKKLVAILIPVLFIFIILLIIVAIVGAVGNLFFWLDDGGSGTATEVNTKENENEKKYFEKLDKVVADYENSCHFKISKSAIHAVLIYRYDNYKDFFEEEYEDVEDLEDLSDSVSDNIDYNNMINNIENVAKLITSKDKCETPDYDIPEDINNPPEGSFYKNLKESSFFSNYYRDFMNDKHYTKDEVLDDIFQFGIIGTHIETENEETETQMFLDDETMVGDTLGNKDVPIDDYVKNEMYGVIPDDVLMNNPELAEAYAIAVTTNTLSKGNYTMDSKIVNLSSSSTTYCDLKKGCHIEEKGGTLIYKTGGAKKASSYNTKTVNGEYYYKLPVTSGDAINDKIKDIYSNVRGLVLYSDNTLKEVDISKLSNATGNNYTSILNTAYDNSVKVVNIGEDSYLYNVDFGNGYTKFNAVFYDQRSYNSTKFCGQTRATISDAGCGTTSMAIVVSTLLSNSNEDKYGPVAMMNEAHRMHYCGPGISGTNAGFFGKEAGLVGLSYYSTRDDNKMIEALLSGKSMVIINVHKGRFTSGGHYMVLGGVNSATKEVYVYDPYNSYNSKHRNSGNGWYNLNDLKSEINLNAHAYYVISKKS